MTADQLKELVVPLWAELQEMELTPAARGVAWTMIRWSLLLGRLATLPVSERDLEKRTGLGHANVVRAMKDLKGFGILRRCGEGWQVVPQSTTYHWGGRRRLVEASQREVARRLDLAQGWPATAVDLPGFDEPKLDEALAEVSAEAAVGMQRGGKIGDLGEGARGTGGGGKKFLSTGGIESKPSGPRPPFKELVPLYREPINTDNVLIRGSGIESKPRQNDTTENDTEAGMEMGASIPDDPTDFSEDVLMRRLMEFLGRKIMLTRFGATLRLFIRGSLEVADDPATAVAMCKALNDSIAAEREGRIKRSRKGYLTGQAFWYAGKSGWKFEAATKSWTRCDPFDTWKVRSALRRSIKEASQGVSVGA